MWSGGYKLKVLVTSEKTENRRKWEVLWWKNVFLIYNFGCVFCSFSHYFWGCSWFRTKWKVIDFEYQSLLVDCSFWGCQQFYSQIVCYNFSNCSCRIIHLSCLLQSQTLYKDGRSDVSCLSFAFGARIFQIRRVFPFTLMLAYWERRALHTNVS